MAILSLKPKNLTYQTTKLEIRWLGTEKRVGPDSYFEWTYWALHSLFVEPNGEISDRSFIIESGNEWLPQEAKMWEKDPIRFEAEINGLLTMFGLVVDPKPIDFPETISDVFVPDAAPEVAPEAA